MNPGTDTVKIMAAARMAIGAAAVLFPALTARLFLLSVKRNPQLPYMTRLFGVREIAVGAMTLNAPDDARTPMVGLGIAVDGSDAFAGLAATRSGAISKPAGILLTGAALGAVAAGAAALAGRR